MGIKNYFGMIVFVESGPRVRNYEFIKSYIKELNIHLAFNTTINKNFKKAFKFGKSKNFFTERLQENLISFKRYGALGNLLSHIMTYQNILNLNYDNYIIFEDDVGFKEDPKKDLNKLKVLLENLPKNYDYISLDYRNSSKECIEKRNYNKFIVKDQYNDLYKVSNLFYKMIPQWGAAAKIISKKGISTILKNLPASASNDNYINELIVQEKLNSFIPLEEVIPFRTQGVLFNTKEKDSKFGSLIWGIKD